MCSKASITVASNSNVRIAVIADVGSGLGASLARRFVQEGCKVALLARTTEYIDNSRMR